MRLEVNFEFMETKNFFRAVTFAAALLAFAEVSGAANYYVDYSAGSDTNNGTSTNSAWKHCPGDPTGSGTPASTSLAAGDTVNFKGGVTYFLANTNMAGIGQGGYGINVGWSGTAANPITYQTAPGWGAGRAIFTDNNGAGMTAFYDTCYCGFSGIVFNNLEIGNMGGSKTLPADPGSPVPARPGAGVGSLHPISNVIIENCYFHDFGYNFNTKPMDANAVSGSSGVYSTGAQSVTVSNCEFFNVGLPISWNYTSGNNYNYNVTNCVVANNKIHGNIHWAMYLAGQSGGTIDSLSIHDNQFYDFDWFFSLANWKGYGGAPHQDGIFIVRTQTNNVTGTNIFIYNNTFFSSTNRGGGATACIYLEGNSSANIYNNIFNNPNGSTPAINIANEFADTSLVRILNNDFLSAGNLMLTLGVNPQWQVYGWFGNGVLSMQNNIFYNCNLNNNYAPLMDYQITNNPVQNGLWTIDYNDYWQANSNLTSFMWVQNPQNSSYSSYNLSGARQLGMELHGMFANAPFKNVSAAMSNVTLDDFHLVNTTPSLAGNNLSALNLPGLSMDKDGNARPAQGQGEWTMGVYQTAIIAPQPPTGLRIISN